jgi:hypothetical protein
MENSIIVRRFPYEEPHNTQLEFIVSNERFCGRTDIYCNVEDLKEIGEALQNYSSKLGEEYRYEYGSENPEDRNYRYFLIRVYPTNGTGRCAIQFAINKNTEEPEEGICRFSIQTNLSSIKQLGILFEKFHQLKHLEFKWSPEGAELFKHYQDAFAESPY